MLGYGAAMKFLKTKSQRERDDIQILSVAARAVQREHDQERAIQVANQVMKGLGG
jgi:hypothetical protein